MFPKQPISKSLMLAFKETDHALLVEVVKCQQRSSEIAREGWRHYCGALADGVRDPQILGSFTWKGGILWVWGGENPIVCKFHWCTTSEPHDWSISDLEFFVPGGKTNTESHCVVVLVVVDLLTRSTTKITTQRESGDSSIEFWELGS